jgi:ABC-2 type transport system ATP-binding protein
MTYPIECRELTKRYGAVVGIEHLDLVVESGTVTGFLGPNAAGKTTVIRVLVGLLRPSGGSAALFGLPAGAAAARERIGYMPADPSFYLALTGAENLDLLGRLQGSACPDRGWAADLLDLPETALRRHVREYSSGMVQKLALVQAVQHRPDLVILDEPANRLDPLALRRFEQLVRMVADDGRTVFLSSHTLSEVQDVCDRVAMVRAGRLLATTSVAELARAEPRLLRVQYRGAPPDLPPELIDPKFEDGVLTARLPGGRVDVVRELIADERVEDVIVEQATLEEAFMDLYEDGGP